MREVELRLPDDESRRLWSSVAQLAADLPQDWVLIGGLMAQLHAHEAGIADVRATMDVDVLEQTRPPGALAAIDAALERDGFELQLPADGLVSRYQRDDLIVDVLAPDGMERGAGVPGGSQALERAESVTVRVDGRAFVVRRPTLLGAILLKTRSLLVHRDPEAQREDLLLLLSLVDDPRGMWHELKPSERRWLRDAAERLELDRPANVGAARMRLAGLTLRLLLREPCRNLPSVCSPNAADVQTLARVGQEQRAVEAAERVVRPRPAGSASPRDPKRRLGWHPSLSSGLSKGSAGFLY